MKTETRKIIENMIIDYPMLEKNEEAIIKACKILRESFSAGGKLLVCGNGGSACDAQHIVGELMKSFKLKRTIEGEKRESLLNSYCEHGEYLANNLQRALPAISLVSEAGFLTAWSNDCDPELVFAQQVYGLGTSDDVLLIISTSGNSKNCIYASEVAREKKMKVIALTGEGGGMLAKHSDLLIDVPERDTYRVQELHLPVYHAICMALENEFFGGGTANKTSFKEDEGVGSAEEQEESRIVFITDENYAPLTGVAISSMIKNKNPESRYNINVISNGVTSGSKEKMKACECEGVTINIIELGENDELMAMSQITEHVSKTALYKFMLADIFSGFSKILYLDSDIIVRRDLSKLYNIEIGDYYALAARDINCKGFNKRTCERLNLKNDFYFNSGVMLLNLELWRRDKLAEKMIEYRKNGPNFLMDQDTLNVIMGDKIKKLSLKYNDQTIKHHKFSRAKLTKLFEENIENMGKYEHKEVVINHFNSPHKPWKSNQPYYTKLYMEYAKNSAFYDSFPRIDELPTYPKTLDKIEFVLHTNDATWPMASFISVVRKKGFKYAIKKVQKFMSENKAISKRKSEKTSDT